jgi:hypothetical protein
MNATWKPIASNPPDFRPAEPGDTRRDVTHPAPQNPVLLLPRNRSRLYGSRAMVAPRTVKVAEYSEVEGQRGEAQPGIFKPSEYSLDVH